MRVWLLAPWSRAELVLVGFRLAVGLPSTVRLVPEDLRRSAAAESAERVRVRTRRSTDDVAG